MELDNCWQVELSMLLSLQHFIMTVKCGRKIKAGGHLADLTTQDSMVSDWGGPSGLIVGPNTPKTADKASSWVD